MTSIGAGAVRLLRHTGHVKRYFSLQQASALLPEARGRIQEIAGLVAELQAIATAFNQGIDSDRGGVAEVKALDARIDEALGWFTRQGILVKGVAPALLDFPALVDGRELLLCWLQGEEEIGWYHPAETGFVGRAPISQLGEAAEGRA